MKVHFLCRLVCFGVVADQLETTVVKNKAGRSITVNASQICLPERTRPQTKIPLAFIFPVSIMRALPHLAALVHRFLTYLSRAYQSRLSKKLKEISGFSG